MQTLDLAALPFDAARRGALRFATRSAFLTRVLGRRDSRIAFLATLQVTLLFALAVRAPVALFFLGPLAFGVVHIAADVRYLVLRRAPPRSLVVASAILAGVITLVQLGVGLHRVSARASDALNVGVGVLWVGFALALALRERRRLLAAAAPVFLVAAWFLVTHGRIVGIVLLHAHNLVAIAAWLLLFRRGLRATVVPLALTLAFGAILVSGVALPWSFAHGGFVAFGMHAERLGAWLAPGVRPELAVALAMTFVFFQGVHYAAWTGWIPQDDLRTEGTPTFRMTLRTLEKEFGAVALSVIAAAALGFVGLAIWNVRESVSWYLVLAKSHAWFELAFLAYFVVTGQRRRLVAA